MSDGSVDARYISDEDCDCEGLCHHCELFGCANCRAFVRSQEAEVSEDALTQVFEMQRKITEAEVAHLAKELHLGDGEWEYGYKTAGDPYTTYHLGTSETVARVTAAQHPEVTVVRRFVQAWQPLDEVQRDA